MMYDSLRGVTVTVQFTVVRVGLFFVLALLIGHYSIQVHPRVRTTAHNDGNVLHTTTLTRCHALMVQQRVANYSSVWYFFNTPKYEQGNLTFRVTGELSLSRPDPNGCTMDDSVRGKIVMTEAYSCSSATKIVACQRVGCLGVIEHNDRFKVAGRLMWSILDTSFSQSQLHAPCVEINPVNGDFMKALMSAPNSIVMAILSSEDPNPYAEFYVSTAYLLIRVFLVKTV